MISAYENKKRALLFVFTCIILWAFIPIISKFGQQDLDNFQFLFWSSLLSFIALLSSTIFLGKFSILIRYNPKEILSACGLGFLGTFLYYLLLYFGYANAKGLEVLVIQYTWPIFIVIFSFLFLKEKITLRNIVAITLGFLGVIIVLTKGDFQTINLSNLWVDFIVLLAASIFGLFSVLSKKINLEPFSATTLFFLSATVLSFITMVIFSHLEVPSRSGLMLILINGVLINGFSYIFWLKGLSYAKASFIAPFVFITPIFASILIVLFFHESFLWIYFVGLILVIFSGLFSK